MSAVCPEYPKIQSIYKRDQKGKFLIGQYSTPEIEYLSNNLWLATEKIDGTNVRVQFVGDNVHFHGKKAGSHMPVTLLERLREMFPWRPKTPDIPDMTICGEGYGKGIQETRGSAYLPNGVDFIVFDIWCGGYWLQPHDVADVCDKLGLRQVRQWKRMSLGEAIEIVKACPTSFIGNAKMEGFVLRPMEQLFDRQRNRIITKVKSKDFVEGAE